MVWILVCVNLVSICGVGALVLDFVRLRKAIEGSSEKVAFFSGAARVCYEGLRRKRLVTNDSAENLDNRRIELRQKVFDAEIHALNSSFDRYFNEVLLAFGDAVGASFVCLADVDKSSFETRTLYCPQRVPSSVRNRVHAELSRIVPIVQAGEPQTEKVARPLGIGNALIHQRVICRIPFVEDQDLLPILWIGFGPKDAPILQNPAFISSCAQIVGLGLKYLVPLKSALLKIDEGKEDLRLTQLSVARVAHDMRSPVGSLEGVLSLLSTNIPSEDSQELIALGREGCTYLKQLSEEMIEAARRNFIAGVNAGRCDLIGVVQTVVASFRDAQGASVVVSSSASGEGSWEVALSAVAVRRIVENLVSNAVKFSNGASVEVSLEWSQAWITVQVKDRGIGVPQKEVSRIFEPFVRGNSAAAGFGLGLSSVKAIVQENHGQLSLQSNEGVGTLVTVKLPRVVHGLSKTTNSAQTLSTSPLKARLVILDDNRDLGDSLKRVLIQRGITAESFTSVDLALECVKEHGASRLLTDYNMPEFSLSNLMCRLRDLSHDVSIAVMSGELSDEVAYSISGMGASAVFTKPLEVDALIDWIGNKNSLDRAA